ncbi:Titin [Manis pentadactyla]|nr:Titin [Manis pentadactyla]
MRLESSAVAAMARTSPEAPKSRQTASRRPASDSERRAAGPRAAQPRTREGLLPPASLHRGERSPGRRRELTRRQV